MPPMIPLEQKEINRCKELITIKQYNIRGQGVKVICNPTMAGVEVAAEALAAKVYSCMKTLP